MMYEKDNEAEVIAAHKLWVETDGRVGSVADFNGARLQYKHMPDVVLRFSDFRCADVSESSWFKADLRYANFAHSQLRRTCFSHANLGYANFKFTECFQTDFAFANLEGASFYGADLRGAFFIGANTKDAMFRGAKVLFEEPANTEVVIETVGPYLVIAHDDTLKIACSLYTFSEWEAFTDDDDIVDLDLTSPYEFLDFWGEYRSYCLALRDRL